MFEALTALLDKNLPFVVFRKPYSKEIQLYFQEDDQLHLTQDFSESGFIMAPFITTDFYSYITKKNNQIAIHKQVTHNLSLTQSVKHRIECT